jgi:hypothetical protein
MNEKMTPEQIKNFRNILSAMIGAYALMMTDEQVIAMRDKFQEKINKMDKESANGK